MRLYSKRGCDGFSLLEVVLALALFGIAVTVLASSYLNVLNALYLIQVDQHLEQDMAMIRQEALMVVDPEKLEDGGEILTGKHGRALWEAEFEGTNIADLFKVTLKAELESENEREPMKIEQEFYLMRPSWSEPAERELLRAETRERFLSKQIGLER